MTAFTEVAMIASAFAFIVLALLGAYYVLRSDNWDD